MCFVFHFDISNDTDFAVLWISPKLGPSPIAGTFLDFRRDFSHNVLPQLAQEGRKFEFIFIDGDHKFDGILVDFYYAVVLVSTMQ